jgi:hypothetical protein
MRISLINETAVNAVLTLRETCLKLEPMQHDAPSDFPRPIDVVVD